MFNQFLFVGFGGFLGAVLRWLTIILFSSRFGLSSIYSILFVNTFGSFLAGLFAGYAALSENVYLKLFFVTGFLGAYTTFSAFSMENLSLLRTGEYKSFILNVVLNIFLTLFFVSFGFIISRKISI